MNLHIAEFTSENLAVYESVGIGYEITSIVVLEDLIATGTITEEPVKPRWKDYDLSATDRPTSLPSVWDMSNWGIFGVVRGDEWLGGAIVARDTPELDLLEARKDLGLIVDLRVRSDLRGLGMGRRLFEHIAAWSRIRGCTELRVETQDVNVAACRFYSAMGCVLLSAERNAYEGLDEVKLIWGARF